MLDTISSTSQLPTRFLQRVRCLACLAWVDPEQACACGTLPPLRYQQYQFEPMALPLLGAPSAGKTAYVEALLSLVPRLTRVWPSFGFSPATEHTRVRYRHALRSVADGALPRPTLAPPPPDPPPVGEGAAATTPAPGESAPPPAPAEPAPEPCVPPLVFLMHGLPNRWQLERRLDGVQVHRALSLHDTPGGDSQLLRLPIERLMLLQRSRRCFMFFDLSEIEEHGSEHMSLLLDSYTETLVECPRSADLHGRLELIVVFTRAEHAHSLPPVVRNYLLKDPLWTFLAPHATHRAGQVSFDDRRLSEYLRGMAITHQHLATWLTGLDGGANFMRLARDYGVRVRLTLVSATGADPLEATVIGGWQPHRVLDPLFWALDLETQERSARSRTSTP